MTALVSEAQTIVLGDGVDGTLVDVETGARSVALRWRDGHTSRFHHIWLRDSCGCPRCKDPHSHQKLVSLRAIPRDVAPESAAITDDGMLEIVWADDGHVSRYPSAWLRRHDYGSGERRRRRFRPQTWDGSINRLPEMAHGELGERGGEADLRLLELIRDYGFALVRDTPTDPASTEDVALRIGHFKPTHFGVGLGEIATVPEARNIAYTSDWIAPHTDNAYDHSPPGPSIFHCVMADQPEGGESLLADGYRLGEVLRSEHPEAFALLSTLWLQQYALDEGAEVRGDGPVFTLDQDGEVVGVRYCECTQAPLDVPDDMVEPAYEALRLMAELVEDQRYFIKFRLSPGDLLVYDNERVLHGRTAFGSQGGRRMLRACYLDRESFHNRLRILGRKYRRPDADWVLPRGVGT